MSHSLFRSDLLRRLCLRSVAISYIAVGMLHGCEKDDSSGADAGTGAVDASQLDLDAAPLPTRGFFMATAGIQANLDGEFFDHDVAMTTLAADSDVIEIHEEFLGIPWAAFAADLPPPPQWVAAMDELATAANDTGSDIFLNVLPGREFLSPRVVINDGVLGTEDHWSSRCYDFASATDGPSLKAAYVRYVEWMVERFKPRWFNVAVEINLFHQACPEAWDGMVDVQRAAYDAVKAKRPETLVFASFALAPLYGYECPDAMREQCYDANYAALAGLKRDRFAVSSYPYLSEFTVDSIPADWFTRAADREGETVIISETGWNSRPAIARFDATCVEAVAGSSDDQLAYLDRLVEEGEKEQVEMFVWWSNTDLLPGFIMDDCPCDDDASWCAAVDAFRATGGATAQEQFFGEVVMKIWGAMGIRNHDGTPKEPIYSHWEGIRTSLPPPN